MFHLGNLLGSASARKLILTYSNIAGVASQSMQAVEQQCYLNPPLMLIECDARSRYLHDVAETVVLSFKRLDFQNYRTFNTSVSFG